MLSGLPLRFLVLLCLGAVASQSECPRVAVTTDINIRQGDPDDRQSLVHLFWYLNELDVKVIVADRSNERRNTGALTACHLAVDAYKADYLDPTVQFRALGYPDPDQLRRIIHGGADDEGVQALIDEARRPDRRPLYVLVWGNMIVLRNALRLAPDIAGSLRVISIGTFHNHRNGKPYAGANSAGRDDIFKDARFTRLWWIEDNDIEGMFAGVIYAPTDPKPGYDLPPIGGAPVEFLEELKPNGALGRHLTEVTQGNDWARYFRAGDTPSVLYLLDPHHSLAHPEEHSWAGQFERPWPDERPNHWTDSAWGRLDYFNPARTEALEAEVTKEKVARFVTERTRVYDALRQKLRALYRRPAE